MSAHDFKTELNRKVAVLQTVEKISEKIASLEKRYAPLGEIANLVNGNNDRKVRLPDFAIAAMFDEVLVAANLRLGTDVEQSLSAASA
jgi:exonuclease SbcC